MLKDLFKYLPIYEALIAIIVFVLIPFPEARASSSEETGLTKLDAVVVSASKTARPAFERPDSVSAVDAAVLDQPQASDIGESLDGLANVEISAGPRSVGEDVNIRGLSNERVLFLVDGARRNFSPAHKGPFFLDPELLKNIEVLREPGSALWGSGALAGVVSVSY